MEINQIAADTKKINTLLAREAFQNIQIQKPSDIQVVENKNNPGKNLISGNYINIYA